MGALQTVDLVVIFVYVALALGVGSLFFREAGKSVQGFFVGDRKLPWWIAGTSIVATTFAADTPLAVAGIVANDGIAGNWIWWCWAIAHLTATFFFARLWRRSGVITDAEITELRYSGRPAAALRAFKAVYSGVFINCLIMAWVISAMVKISIAFFPEVSPALVIMLCILVSVAYTTLGGFRGVVITDLVQFTLGMIGAVVVAWYALEPFGGLGALPDKDDAAGSGMLGRLAETVTAAGEDIGDVVDFLPASDHPTIPAVYFAVLLIAGWWRYAEGNGYIVQRLAASKDEGHAQGASLWFTVAHNALRPWPWILVGLVALIVFPKLPTAAESLQATVQLRPDGPTTTVTVTPASLDVARGGVLTFSGVAGPCEAQLGARTTPLRGEGQTATATFGPFDDGGVFDLLLRCPDAAAPPTTIGPLQVRLDDREMAYPLMMRKVLPAGVLGLVIASLLAAFMSTIDTHTNWGASYLVTDVYRRFIAPDKDELHYTRVSRLSIVVIAVLAGITATFIGSIAAVWRFLIALGAGLGSVTAARWYWSRVTAHAEFAAIGVTTVLAVGLELFCTPTLFGSVNPVFIVEVPAWAKIVLVAGASLLAWVPVALWGPKNSDDTLRAFYEKVRPPGPGWTAVAEQVGPSPDSPSKSGLGLLAGLVITFNTLFGIGELLIGSTATGLVELAVAVVLLAFVIRAGRGRRT